MLIDARCTPTSTPSAAVASLPELSSTSHSRRHAHARTYTRVHARRHTHAHTLARTHADTRTHGRTCAHSTRKHLLRCTHTHRRGSFRWRTSLPHRTRWTARKLRTETSGSHGNFRIAQNPLDCTYFLLNGEYQPTLSLTSGGWKRLRLVQSAHQSAFRFDIAGCGVALRGGGRAARRTAVHRDARQRGVLRAVSVLFMATCMPARSGRHNGRR